MEGSDHADRLVDNRDQGSDLRSKRKPNANAVNNVQNGASGRADGLSSAAVNAEH